MSYFKNKLFLKVILIVKVMDWFWTSGVDNWASHIPLFIPLPALYSLFLLFLISIAHSPPTSLYQLAHISLKLYTSLNNVVLIVCVLTNTLELGDFGLYSVLLSGPVLSLSVQCFSQACLWSSVIQSWPHGVVADLDWLLHTNPKLLSVFLLSRWAGKLTTSQIPLSEESEI